MLRDGKTQELHPEVLEQDCTATVLLAQQTAWHALPQGHTAPQLPQPLQGLRNGYLLLASSVTMLGPKTEKQLRMAEVTYSRVLLQEFLPSSTRSKSIVVQVLFPLHPKLEPPQINSVGKLISHFNEITANFMYQRTTSWKHAVTHLPPLPDFSQALVSSSYFEANVLILVTKPRLISWRENITSSLRCLEI